MIRPATIADIDPIVEMARPFLDYSMFADHTQINDDDLIQALCNLLDNGIILVAEKDSKIIGALCGMMSQFWFSPKTKVAIELGWWIQEEHRSGMSAVRLLNAFEDWAKNMGASVVSLSDLRVADDYPAGKLFNKLGYSVVERAHLKGVH
jgi:hypothetical protein